ncbi:hypothetical protein NSU09_12625 [Bacillus sp. PS194]|uniref:hypothetical protein n=1 Tax=Bacillus TaxID=1386 RepID=UPI00129ED845|nr:hypothetical protein [Bacillus subtilis]MBL3637599.1 hypothetical protein [Alkalicoccobacillus gibsonii]MCM3008465.1 hypothetical protein [Bacillus subtilis]MDK8206105.1 hypothetical protein [Bacillus subtilis]QGI09327.1 hypothetical protein GII79_11240 [Bacillus subtilis]QGI17919.1 hypothetical protein GII81_11470 [Bacillus subtilis]
METYGTLEICVREKGISIEALKKRLNSDNIKDVVITLSTTDGGFFTFSNKSHEIADFNATWEREFNEGDNYYED